MSDLALPKACYTHRVVAMAVRLVVEDGLPYRTASWHLWRDSRVFVPWGTIQNWVEASGKKSETSIGTEYINKVLDNFSGYIAAEELYDGPFCVLFIVHNHNFRRLCYEVLDHDPTHEDITRFFKRFNGMHEARELTLKGITTDGSSLYPDPIAKVFGKVKHQICRFHILQEITKAITKSVAKVRKDLKGRKIKCPRGRPSGKEAKEVALKNKRLQSKIAELFEYRYLFVKHLLTPKEKKILQRITRELPQLRTLRSIMDEVYRLFDRCCRMDTALAKLAVLRRRVNRFKKLRKPLKSYSRQILRNLLPSWMIPCYHPPPMQ